MSSLGLFISGAFKVNIVLYGSKKFNRYIFKEPQDPSAEMTRTVEVLLDDELELRLFQVHPLSDLIDSADIKSLLHFDTSTIPDRNALFEWAYGDVREVMAVATFMTKKVGDYCQNKVGGLFQALVDDTICMDSDKPFPFGFPNYFSRLTTGLQILASYGISGDISVASLNEYGREVSLSLIRPDSAKPSQKPPVPYCSPIETATGIPTGKEFADFIKSVEASCNFVTSLRRETKRHFDSDFGLLNLFDANQVSPSHDSFAENISSDTGIVNRALTSSRVLKGAPGSNELNLTLQDAGVDDKGFWKCYTGLNDVARNPKCWGANAQTIFDSYDPTHLYGYQNPVFGGVDVSYENVDVFKSNATLRQMFSSWKSNAGQPPRLEDAGLSMRFSVDGTSSHESDPDCNGAFVPPVEVKAFEYAYKTRLRVWGARVKQIRVWLCCTNCIDPIPTNVSILDISSHVILQPGPYVTLALPLKTPFTNAEIAAYHERLCVVVWSVLDERCKSRSWSSLSNTQNRSEIVTTWLFTSNSRATRGSYLITQQIYLDEFKTVFPKIDADRSKHFSVVHAPGPSPKLTKSDPFSCLSHYDCDEGLFCSTNALHTAESSFQGGGGPGIANYGCELCRYCLSDSSDPIDRYCPRDKCGSNTGSYPDCVDTSVLFSNFTCPDTYKINMSKVPPPRTKSTEPDEIPLSSSASTARKARFVSPYNQLIGALSITQTRSSGVCLTRNDSVARYSAAKTPGLGPVCRGEITDASPYGVDPTFTGFSTLYRGDLDPLDFYTSSELQDSGTPFGFFPHSYDGVNHSKKPPKFIKKDEESVFKIYFTERMTGEYATKLVNYLRDGNFLDEKTNSVSVEMRTINAKAGIFASINIFFAWKDTGEIVWDYRITSVPVYQYQDYNLHLRVALEVICVIFLVVNCLSEAADIYEAVKQFDIMGYVSFWNMVDLAHFAIMWFGWSLWLTQVIQGQSLNMPVRFGMLVSAGPETPARYFRTDPSKEYDFLMFFKAVDDMASNWTLYSVITSLSVILFLLRLLKIADFQPRIALITRTIKMALSELMNFGVLFMSLLIGYAIAGILLFGHQNAGFESLSPAILNLLIMLLAWDPYTWVQLNHAAPDWAVNIYIWSWLFLAFFVLLNIFLAILVDGFVAVKAITVEENSPGMLDDLKYIWNQQIGKLSKFLGWNPSFISDEELVAGLSSACSSKLKSADVLEQYYRISLTSFMAIKSKRGVLIDATQLFQVLQKYFPNQIMPDPQESKGTQVLLDPLILNLMMNYGTVTSPPDAETKRKQCIDDFMELSQLESMKRIALMFHGHDHESSINIMETEHNSNDAVILNVCIEQAQNIPKMDVFRGADVFCVVFLEGSTEIYQTEVKRGTSSWTWDPELSAHFSWKLRRESDFLDPDRCVVVMVYDKDQFSSDDVIGCVKIRLGDIVNGVYDGWQEIIRPPDAPKKQFLFFNVPIGELKLKVTITDSIRTAN